MKVYISKYRYHWISPYTILERVFFWTEWSKCGRWTLEQILEDEKREKSAWVDYPEWVERWSDRLMPICKFVENVLDIIHPRVEYVKIDPWDTWSMDHTLAYIVLPMLKQLKEKKHGAPFVDLEDVPEELQGKRLTKKQKDNGELDDKHFERWDWVLAEMIFAFEMKCRDNWEDEFHSGEIDFKSVPVDAEGNVVPRGEHKYFRMDRGPNDTHVYDAEGAKRVQDRISNGFRLFGKYYESLWD